MIRNPHNANAVWELPPPTKDDLLAQLRSARGITKDELQDFLHPHFPGSLADPAQLPDIAAATNRMLKAVQAKERIGIFGDYDADGTCGTVLMEEIITALGHAPSLVVIPNREEGYGLSLDTIKTLQKKAITLLVTVDTGTTAVEEILKAKKAGIDVIVFDHHEPPPVLPKALALVNPKVPSAKFEFLERAATGVVFGWAHYLHQKGHLTEAQLKWWLDLVAIATIADMVPLVGDNRVLARFGLVVLQKTRRPGLRALYQAAGIQPEKINAYTVGFQIAPRLNAAGRIASASTSYALLGASTAQSTELAEKLNTLNQRRQMMLEQILAEAFQEVEARKLDRHKALILKNVNWPRGIVGLVSGRLMEQYHRPVIILEEQKSTLTGSGRAPARFHLIEGLAKVGEHLERYGGHARAGGLQLQVKNFAAFEAAFLQHAKTVLQDEDLVPRLKADARAELSMLTGTFWDELKLWEPFGYGNPQPVLYLSNLKITNPRTFGAQALPAGKQAQHLSWEQGGIRIIGFGLAAELIDLREPIDLLVTGSESSYNGTVRHELIIRAWRVHKDKE